MDYTVFNIYKTWRKAKGKENAKKLFNASPKLTMALVVVLVINSIAILVIDVLKALNAISHGSVWMFISFATLFIVIIILYILTTSYYKNNTKKNLKAKQKQAKILKKELKAIGYKTKNQLKQLCNRMNEKYEKGNLWIQRMQKIINSIFISLFIPINLKIFEILADKNFDITDIIYITGYGLIFLFASYWLLLGLVHLCKVFICHLNTIEEMIEDIHYILDYFFPIDDNDV